MASTSKAVEIIFKGSDQVSPKVKDIRSSLDGLDSDAREAGDSFDELGESAEGFGAGALGSMKLLAGAVAAIGASALADEFIKANQALEQFDQALTFATGSTEGAKAEIEFLRDISDTLGLNLISSADAYKRFYAAAGDTLNLQDTRDIFTAVAGTLSAVGGTADDVNGAMIQLSQGISKGRFELEDLKSIAERLPGFFGKFAQSLDVSTEEFFKLISAGEIGTEELKAFAAVLNEDLAGADFSGFTQAANRFDNALTNLATALGDTGVFDIITGGVELAAEAVDNGTQSIGGFQSAYGNLKDALSGDQGILDSFLSLEKAILAAALSGVGFGEEAQAWLAPVQDTSEEVEGLADRVADIPEPAAQVAQSMRDLAKEALKANSLLKEIGVDPKQLEEPIERVLAAFEELSQLDGISGEDLFSGLVVALDKITEGDSIRLIQTRLSEAFSAGRINADEYENALAAVQAKQDALAGDASTWASDFAPVAGSLQDTKESAEEASKAVKKTELDLEKLASNERVKAIEAKVTLNVAQIEADAEVAVAALDSISETITSTGDLLGDLFGTRGSASSWEQKRQIENQIGLENERREDATKRQNKLIDEQIRLMREKRKALQQGASMIEVDGAGLQPHLEAFMFEILEAIQVRVNAEGHQLLLGV